jgi:acetolactate decarboxylase
MGKLFQASTIMALMSGDFDYSISIEYFLKNGDTGIGSYNGLNGEAIFLNGVAYNATASGNVKIMDIPQTGVTFGQIARFDESHVTPFDTGEFHSKAELDEKLKPALLKGPNSFYMIKAKGTFSSITVRSAYKQRKPFRRMSLVSKEMKYFTYKDIKGVLVGVYSPSFTDGLSFKGWHLHFLSEDLSKGGHVTDLSSPSLQVISNLLEKYEIKFPTSKEYYETDFTKNSLDELYQGYVVTEDKKQ